MMTLDTELNDSKATCLRKAVRGIIPEGEESSVPVFHPVLALPSLSLLLVECSAGFLSPHGCSLVGIAW